MSVNLDELVVLIYKFMKHVEPTRISVNWENQWIYSLWSSTININSRYLLFFFLCIFVDHLIVFFVTKMIKKEKMFTIFTSSNCFLEYIIPIEVNLIQ